MGEELRVTGGIPRATWHEGFPGLHLPPLYRNLRAMTVTLQVPDELAPYLPGTATGMAAVISAGLQAGQRRRKHECRDLNDVVEFLAGLPDPADVLALHAPAAVVARADELLERTKGAGLTPDEQAEWDEIARVEHLVRMVKTKALFKLKTAEPGA